MIRREHATLSLRRKSGKPRRERNRENQGPRGICSRRSAKRPGSHQKCKGYRGHATAAVTEEDDTVPRHSGAHSNNAVRNESIGRRKGQRHYHSIPVDWASAVKAAAIVSYTRYLKLRRFKVAANDIMRTQAAAARSWSAPSVLTVTVGIICSVVEVVVTLSAHVPASVFVNCRIVS